MKKKIKKIGIITRDCAGINAAIRAVVRASYRAGFKTTGIIRGYEGLIENNTIELNPRSVSGIINRGGTILKTARAKQFRYRKGQKQAVKTLESNNIDALVVIGGNGSLTGASILSSQYSVPVVGIPATIDNDINGVAMSIGADTSLNVALGALDKIRDTATSLERIFVVEVMGRDCGYIALRAGLAGGCEDVILPEKKLDIKEISKEISEGNIKGKKSWIVVVAEGKAKAADIAKKITKLTGLETREVVLGHIQRGGRPTAYDRILAARYGYHAIELIEKGQTGRCVTLRDDKLSAIPLSKAIKKKDIEVNSYYKLIKILT
ncbi:MAG: 6-phosphofructokinase [Candidatus Omnitrophica bacterium]|nr:6-phosphofructokinase [Candidatus Omnitrophota bacterium]MCF7877756.1 6-phosphofructokinase [Candidatus Omnitrophota bacterium]MCF7892072.1 6-phosphofructokinase [Candidatus Omnitrophota bacterium]MCF7895894.1 6-phosphofructokinase [Candidatus Omnitrophota bacterium]MCF7897814.1 6-phosphofructokinase [Candidatus Omnitrophota bacterium]